MSRRALAWRRLRVAGWGVTVGCWIGVAIRIGTAWTHHVPLDNFEAGACALGIAGMTLVSLKYLFITIRED